MFYLLLLSLFLVLQVPAVLFSIVYKKGEGLGSLTSLNMAAILNFAEKFIYLYIEIKLMNIDIRVSAKYYLHVAYEVI